MLDSANIVFKKINLVIEEAKPSDICNKIDLSSVNLKKEHSISGSYFYSPWYNL